ncbi:hypothetical protein ACJX0J_031581, partial [Zea mays]
AVNEPTAFAHPGGFINPTCFIRYEFVRFFYLYRLLASVASLFVKSPLTHKNTMSIKVYFAQVDIRYEDDINLKYMTEIPLRLKLQVQKGEDYISYFRANMWLRLS